MLWLGEASDGGLEHAEALEVLLMLALSACMRRRPGWNRGGGMKLQVCEGVAEELVDAWGAMGHAAEAAA